MSVAEGGLNTPDGRPSGHCSRINDYRHTSHGLLKHNGIPHGADETSNARRKAAEDRVRPPADNGYPKRHGGQGGGVGKKGKLLFLK